MLASLNSRCGRPHRVRITRFALFALSLFSSQVFSANLYSSSESIDIQFEQGKLQRYEQRIERLESTIQTLRSELELLQAEHNRLEVSALSLQKSLQSVSEKYASVGSQLDNVGDIELEARQRHADFEIYLAERKYNRVLRELNETQHQMARTTEYLQDRMDLLKRNRQGVVWQKQVLKKFRKPPSLESIDRQLSERLAHVQ